MRSAVAKLANLRPALLWRQEAASVQQFQPFMVGSSSDDSANQQSKTTSQLPAANSQLSVLQTFKPRSSLGFSALRGMAESAGANVPANSWSKFRAPYGFDKKTNIGAAMYISIMVFGFGALTVDIQAYSPRVLGIMGLVFFLLYTRRG
mmetsp:Transcript_13650/g.29282  ORF Transcript_13650/g.29282 Transcript_13650/m.29282 type:complete len:149 (-) Transcript_13650:333-779(-)